MEKQESKRRYGPIPRALEKLKKNHIGVYLDDANLADIANRAGTHVPKKMEGVRSGGDISARKKIAKYIRAAALGALPPMIPTANIEIWNELKNPLTNLNQIAKKLNQANALEERDWIEIGEIHALLTELRNHLIGSES